MEHLTLGKLSGHHLLEVIMDDLGDNGMIDALSLQDNPPTFVLPSGTPRHLSHQLEGALIRAEVGIVQHRIRIQYADHADMGKVQSFRDHLRTDQDICLALFEVCDDALVCRTGTGGIQIHASYRSFRKQGFDIIFYLLRPETAVT